MKTIKLAIYPGGDIIEVSLPHSWSEYTLEEKYIHLWSMRFLTDLKGSGSYNTKFLNSIRINE